MTQILSLAFLGVVAVFWLAVLLRSAVRIRHAAWIVALVLFFASIGVALDYSRQPRPNWLLLVQTYRAEIYAVLSASLVVPITMGYRHFRGVSPQAVVLVLIALFSALMLGVHEGPLQGVQTLLIAIFTLLPLAICIQMLLREEHDFIVLLRSLAVVNALIIGVTLVQFAIDPRFAYVSSGATGTRFTGPTANPQAAALVLATLSSVVLWLALNDARRLLKVVYISLLCTNALLLLWTGSRTGMVITLIGVAAVLYARVGRAVLLLPVFALVGFGLFKALGQFGSDVEVERLTSMEDTRRQAWRQLFETGMQSPLTGVGLSESLASENSYLYAFSAYGIGMVLLLVVLTFVCAVQCWRLAWIRRSFPRNGRVLVDLVLGFNAMYFASAMAEGHMIGRVSPMIVMMVIFSGVLSALLRYRLLTEEHPGEDAEEPPRDDEQPILETETALQG